MWILLCNLIIKRYVSIWASLWPVSRTVHSWLANRHKISHMTCLSHWALVCPVLIISHDLLNVHMTSVKKTRLQVRLTHQPLVWRTHSKQASVTSWQVYFVVGSGVWVHRGRVGPSLTKYIYGIQILDLPINISCLCKSYRFSKISLLSYKSVTTNFMGTKLYLTYFIVNYKPFSVDSVANMLSSHFWRCQRLIKTLSSIPLKH